MMNVNSVDVASFALISLLSVFLFL